MSMDSEIKFKYTIKHNVTGLIQNVVFEYFEVFNGLAKSMFETGPYRDYTILKKGQYIFKKDKHGEDIFVGDTIEWDYEYDSDYDGDMPIVKRSAGRHTIKDIFDRTDVEIAARESKGCWIVKL